MSDFDINEEDWQSAKDVIVDGVLGSKPPENYRMAIETFEGGLWERDSLNKDELFVDEGTWIPNDKVPTGFDLLAYDAAYSNLEEKRIAELELGAVPTKDEYVVFLRSWLASNSEDPDADEIPAFGLHPLTHSDGRKCYFLSMITGYSFTEINEWIEGYFSDQSTAKEYLRANGFIGYDIKDEKAVQKFMNDHYPSSATLPNITDQDKVRLLREESEAGQKKHSEFTNAMLYKLRKNRELRAEKSLLDKKQKKK